MGYIQRINLIAVLQKIVAADQDIGIKAKKLPRYSVVAIKLGTPKQEILDKLAADHYVSLEITDKGNVWINYNSPEDERSQGRVSLDAKKKIIQTDFNKVKSAPSPAIQQLIKFILAEGFIDKTWKIQQSIAPRYHKSEELDFDFFTDPRNALTKSFNGKLVLYHGTSSEDWEKIKKTGLVPLMHGSNKEYGFESRYKHEGNEKVLYLTGSLSTAEDYAKTRCNSLKNKAKRAGKRVDDEYSGDGVWIGNKQVSTVVIEVTVPDVSRLVADDDHVNEEARALADKLWKEKPAEEKAKIVEKLKKEHASSLDPNWNGWRDPTHQVMLWRETDEGFKEILSHIPKERYKQWFESLKQRNQVGYRGIIPPKFLKAVEKLPKKY